MGGLADTSRWRNLSHVNVEVQLIDALAPVEGHEMA
jgi:hypothetical protein